MNWLRNGSSEMIPQMEFFTLTELKLYNLMVKYLKREVYLKKCFWFDRKLKCCENFKTQSTYLASYRKFRRFISKATMLIKK